jgi:hypothetical protein
LGARKPKGLNRIAKNQLRYRSLIIIANQFIYIILSIYTHMRQTCGHTGT